MAIEDLTPEQKEKAGRDIAIIPGHIYRWRVCGLNDTVLKILLSLPADAGMRVGKAQLRLVETVADGSMDTGVVDEEALIAGALGINAARSLTFQFLTPATFRREDMDYPLPLPELVFGSLAQRWTENEMPLQIDHGRVRDMAWHVKPFHWQGRSVFGYLSKGRGITGFKGTYTYSLEGIDREWQQIFMMLGQYASFAGIGRLTGQGFGRVQFSWR